MPLPLLPDAEELLVAALAAVPEITAIVGTRVGTERQAVYPALIVTRVGGGPESGSADDAAVQVDCWAEDDATASLLARTVVAAHRDLRRTTAAGWIALTDVPSGPIPAPEEDTGRHRYIVTVEARVGW